MLTISDDYRELNRRLHESRDDYGRSGAKWTDLICKVIEDDGGYADILDFGCGKGTLAIALAEKGHAVREYDPAIPCKDATPDPAELVICGDVLEHIEPERLDAVVAELKRVTKRKLVVVIDTARADKYLPDGRNAHLIIENAAWWGGRLARDFDILNWRVAGRKIFGELAHKLPGKLPVKRRTAPDGWAAQNAYAKSELNRYADALSRIETVNMWEGVDDEVADLQVAVWIIEHMPDVAAAIYNVACLTSKAALFIINLNSGREPRYWRQMIEQRFAIYDFRIEGNVLNVIGAPRLSMQGLKAVGVVSAEDRWEQSKAAMARYRGRVHAASAHGRLAVLACYGPSLRDTIEALRLETLAPDADVVSVSGAHDFLIERGISPDYHIECDPRAHKADNIAAQHPGTRYLLASCVHTALFDKLGRDADIALWHIASVQHSRHLIDDLGEDQRIVVTGGGSVGLRSISLLYGMGYRRFAIHGLDCSFAGDGQQQHAGKHAGAKQGVVTYPCGGRQFVTSYTLQTYATDFLEMIQRVNDLDIKLHGNGLLQAMVGNMGTQAEEAA